MRCSQGHTDLTGDKVCVVKAAAVGRCSQGRIDLAGDTVGAVKAAAIACCSQGCITHRHLSLAIRFCRCTLDAEVRIPFELYSFAFELSNKIC